MDFHFQVLFDTKASFPIFGYIYIINCSNSCFSGKAERYLDHSIQTKQVWDVFITYKVRKEIPLNMKWDKFWDAVSIAIGPMSYINKMLQLNTQDVIIAMNLSLLLQYYSQQMSFCCLGTAFPKFLEATK